MRLIALLLLPSLACAEPAPQQSEKLDVEVNVVELKLSSTDRNVVEITIQNNGQEPLLLPYRVTPFEHFVVELQGENGKQYKIEHTGKKVDKEEPGTLTVPAGKSKTLSVHDRPDERLNVERRTGDIQSHQHARNHRRRRRDRDEGQLERLEVRREEQEHHTDREQQADEQAVDHLLHRRDLATQFM